MKRHLLLILCLLTGPLLSLAQPRTWQCHIVDAATGKALPYVSIFASKSNTTLSNHEGDFSLSAQASDEVCFQLAGYHTLKYKAADMPQTVSMTALEVQGKTLTTTTDQLLAAVVKKLNKEYKSKGLRRGQYFFRMTSKANQKDELMEAFLDAQSAINLRDLTIISGRHGRMAQWGLIRPTQTEANFLHMLELGPMIQGIPFWNSTGQPLWPKAGNHYFEKYYTVGSTVLHDKQQGEIYCLDMQRRNETDKGLIVGRIYLKASTLQPLRFEGEVTDMQIETKPGQLTSVQLKLHVNYMHDNGYTEVGDISCSMDDGKDLSTRIILHNISRYKQNYSKYLKIRKRKRSALDAGSVDADILAHAGIIQRTKHEEELALQLLTPDSAALTKHTGQEQLDKLIDRVRLFGKRIPQEKVFLHMDNTCYFLGDTIWYAAYTRQTGNGKPSHISNVLYVELLNNDGYVMERQVVKMRDGRGHGNIYLDPEYYAGFYEIRAYTRWQLNWGVSEREHGDAAHLRWFVNETKEHEFFRDYDKLYSRVVPVYDHPKDSMDFVHDMTLRPLRRYFRKDPDKRKLQLTLFPEGGQLIEGIPCRVAFEAAWDDGEWEEGTLQMDSLQSVALHRGRGTFIFTPSSSRPQKPVFTTTKGEKVSAKWPKIQESGVALRVDYAEPKWKIELQMTEDIQPDSLALTVMHEGVLTHVQALNSRHKIVELSDQQLAPGVHQVTVFGQSGRVYADRLFFVTSPDLTEPSLSIEGLKDEYRPFERIELDVQATQPDQAASRPISMAVRDAWTQDHVYDTGNMLTEMLLASEVKGFIPHPEWYFESQDEEHRQGLDLLMMTQGWRRFSWYEMAVPGAFELTQPDEKGLVVDGMVEGYMSPGYVAAETRNDPTLGDHKVNEMWVPGLPYNELLDLFSKHPKKELTVHAELVEGQTLQAIQTEMKTQGLRFRFRLPDFYDRSILFLSTADLSKVKPGKNYNWIQSAYNYEMQPSKHRLKWELMSEDPDFMVYVSQPWPRYAMPFSWYQNHLAPAPSLSEGQLGRRRFSDGTIELNEVSVKAKRNGLRKFSDTEPALFADAYDAYNNAMDAGFQVDPEFIVRGYVGDMGLYDPYTQTQDEEGREGKPTSKISVRFGLNEERRAHQQSIDTDSVSALQSLGGQEIDTLYHKSHLWSMEYQLSPGEMRYYFSMDDHGQPTDRLNFFKLDKFFIYTDYMPRHSGERRYMGSDMPETKLAMYPFADGGQRVFYRDRRYVIQGFNIADEFYHPDYSQRALPKDGAQDRRRTLYWNPDLQLDAQGHAHVSLYNCGRNVQLSVTAEGMTKEGVILTGKKE